MSDNLYIFGLHAVYSVIQNSPQRIIKLFVQNDRVDAKIKHLQQLAKDNRIVIHSITKLQLDKTSNGAVHQGVMAHCEKAKNLNENDLEKILDHLSAPAFLLLLDGVQDPHNLGACLRTADAAGVHAVIVAKDKSVSITPTVTKVASGATETVPFIQVTNLARTMKDLKDRGIWIYGAAGEAESTLYQTKLTGAIAIVLGAEGDGLRRLTRENCDVLLNIPMQGSVSSLNVSVATGVFLFEALRQRV